MCLCYRSVPVLSLRTERVRERSEMAYAALVSLKHTIQRLLNPSQSRILLPNSEMEFIYRELFYLQSFLETISSLQSSHRVDDLERQIKDAAHEFEDLIESHISDRFLSESESSGDESLTLVFSEELLLKVKQKVSNFIQMLKTEEHRQRGNSFASDAVSPRIDFGGKNKMVGLHDGLVQLKDLLVSGSPHLVVISIVGWLAFVRLLLPKKFMMIQLF
ncbi:hypothetical protein Pfo_011073 [Paulownia fortunei]|nr:hypothetical protein Pfo_011073 [Paulownia fortunei]